LSVGEAKTQFGEVPESKAFVLLSVIVFLALCYLFGYYFVYLT